MNSRECALTARFGRFHLDSHRRELLADGVPVTIGSRAFEVLVVLVEARGQIVTKDELASRVWPGRFIEDNCLQFQISSLRKALAADRDIIKTIPGRGYCFTADLTTHAGPDVVPVAPRGESQISTPSRRAMSDLIGQEAASTVYSDLVAALQLAARADAIGIVETCRGTEQERRVQPEITQAWIATAGQPLQSEFALPAGVRIAEYGPATPERLSAALVPTRLFLLLSFEPVVLGRKQAVAQTQETLAV